VTEPERTKRDGLTDRLRAVHILDHEDAVVVGIRRQSLSRASHGRSEAQSVLEICMRTGWFTSARVNFRVGSTQGSTQIDAGWVVESFSFLEAVDAAQQLARILECVSVGLETELWTLPSTSFNLPERPEYLTRVVPGPDPARWCADGPRYSPLIEALGADEVDGVVSVALVPGLKRPSADLICVSSDATTSQTLGSLAAFEVSSNYPTGLSLVPTSGDRAASALAAVAGAWDEAGALDASAIADLYSTTRRSYSAQRIYGVHAPVHAPEDSASIEAPDIRAREAG